jgi:glycosyltransferase involved in cell wall biosynthesis
LTIAGRSIGPDIKVVSFVANAPDWLRGFDRFLDLANRLLRERSDVVCVVAGGGPVGRMLDVRHHGRDYVKECLEKEPPFDPDRFWTLGPCTPRAVSDLLNRTDLFVSPSRPFSVALPMVEAMSSGSVVMAWDSAPVREFLDDESTGLLVPPDDPDAAARIALRVLDALPAHRPLGEAAARRVRESFSQDACLPHLASMFDRLAHLS